MQLALKCEKYRVFTVVSVPPDAADILTDDRAEAIRQAIQAKLQQQCGDDLELEWCPLWDVPHNNSNGEGG